MLSWDELAQDPIAIAIAAAVLVLLVATVIVLVRRRKQRQARRDVLQRRFGAEYERTVREGRSRKEAEEDLDARREHHAHLELHPLAANERELYRARFEEFQASFVDEPQAAVRSVDGLIDEVAEARGYREVAGISRLGLVSVDHPEEVAAHRRGLSQLSAEGRKGTEDMRQALLSARELLERLVSEGEAQDASAPEPPRTLLGLDEDDDDLTDLDRDDRAATPGSDVSARSEERTVRSGPGEDVDGAADGDATYPDRDGRPEAGSSDVASRSEERTLSSRPDEDGQVTETVDLTAEEREHGAPGVR